MKSVSRPPKPALADDDLGDDPIVELRRWFAEAQEAGEPQPDAMALATADASGKPSNRMVLVKGIDTAGLAFYTNYQSAKAGDLAANPRAAAVLFWYRLHRQVRIEGSVIRLTRAESAAYFRTRPYGAQISAAASPQSRPIERTALETEVRRLRERFPAEVPLPRFWGGFRLKPLAIEFWQGREDRLHDRIRYVRTQTGWRRERLAP